MGIVVENPGVLTTIQDKGRYGYEQFGVSPSGPMDLESFQIANILVGNSRDLSALEATMLGPTLRFTQDNIIAVTGGDMMPLLDEKPLAHEPGGSGKGGFSAEAAGCPHRLPDLRGLCRRTGCPRGDGQPGHRCAE